MVIFVPSLEKILDGQKTIDILAGPEITFNKADWHPARCVQAFCRAITQTITQENSFDCCLICCLGAAFLQHKLTSCLTFVFTNTTLYVSASHRSNLIRSEAEKSHYSGYSKAKQVKQENYCWPSCKLKNSQFTTTLFSTNLIKSAFKYIVLCKNQYKSIR